MILVQNLHQLLSGNRLFLLLFICLYFQSCGILAPAAGDKEPKEKKPRKETKAEDKEEDLPPIQGTRVYDPVKNEWVIIDNRPKEKVDTLQFTDASSNELPPITMEGTAAFLPRPAGESNSGLNTLATYNVSVLLPFKANKLDPLSESIDDQVSNWALQFYGAMKIAMQEMQDGPLKLDVNIIDTESSQGRVRNIIENRNDLSNTNIIIGPYRRDNIRLLAEFAKEKDKILISPYSASTTLTKENPNFIQVSPSLGTHCESLLKHARNEFEPEEIVVVARDIPIEKMGIKAIQKEHFNILGTPYADSLEYLIAPSNTNDLFDLDMDSYFAREDKLAFIIPSWSDESFIYGLLRKIDLARKENQQIVVYGMPQWMDYEHIDFEYYEKLNVRVSSSFFVDNSSEEIKAFRRNFYDRYGILPKYEAYLGYDLIKFVGSNLEKYGLDFVGRMDVEPTTVLHTKFNFQKVLKDGPDAVELQQVERMENKYVNILEFRNYAFELSRDN